MKKYKDIVGDGGSNILGQVGEQMERLKARMAKIRHKVAVMSGKGGVGKSSITANLAVGLASKGYTVGVLDADVNGPSLAKMMGVRGQKLKITGEGIQPAISPGNIRAMSMDLLLPTDETPVIWDAPTQQEAFVWRGTMEVTALREFLADTNWDHLDFLLLDLPPGTDRLPNLVELLPDLGGTLVVTIPSEVSQLIVKKSITLAKDLLKTPVIGLVENMAGYVCLRCGALGELFPSHTGQGTEDLARTSGIPFLGKIPFDPRIATATDSGIPFLLEYQSSLAGQAFSQITRKVEEFFKMPNVN